MSVTNLEDREVIRLDTAYVATTTLGGSPLKCKEPGCDDQRIFSNQSALRYTTFIHTIVKVVLLTDIK
jgi:hypothetical protein